MSNPLGMMAFLCGSMVLFWGVVIGLGYLIYYLVKRSDNKVELRPSKASQSAEFPIAQINVSAGTTNPEDNTKLSPINASPSERSHSPTSHSVTIENRSLQKIPGGNNASRAAVIENTNATINRTDGPKKEGNRAKKVNVGIDFEDYPPEVRVSLFYKFDHFMKQTVLTGYEQRGYEVGTDIYSYNLRKRKKSLDYKIFGYKYYIRKGNRLGTTLMAEWNRDGDTMRLGIAHTSKLGILLFKGLAVFGFFFLCFCSILFFHLCIKDIFSSIPLFILVSLLALIPGIIGLVIGALLSTGINRLFESKKIRETNDNNEKNILKVAEEKLWELKRSNENQCNYYDQ